MSQINARNIPEDLYNRVRLCAANGGSRIPKGGLQRFLIRALRRAVADPQPGAGLPKLKLCAKCVAANLELVSPRKSAYNAAAVEIDTAKTRTKYLSADVWAKLDEETDGPQQQPSTHADLADA